MAATRVPLNFFGMPFGLAGLGGLLMGLAQLRLLPAYVRLPCLRRSPR